MSETASSLPAHGRVACSKCFNGPTVWNETEIIAAGWHIVNNPMSWGAAVPRYLVLGVSKGTTQCDAISAKVHNDVPFAGFRPILTKALQLLGLLQDSETVDSKISESELMWGFGSMIRCAIGIPKEDSAVKRSGTVVQKLAAMPFEQNWITRCSSAFLQTLPKSLRVVVLLSNDDGYIEACFAAIRRLRPNTRLINDVAYGDDEITWVHIVHVGGPGRNHIASWFEGIGRQGNKRISAQKALGKLTSPLIAQVAVEKLTTPLESHVDFNATLKPFKEPTKPLIIANHVRDKILKLMNDHAFFHPHPSETMLGGTKYVSAFIGKNGEVIAFEKNLTSKQPMWLRDVPYLRALLDTLRVRYNGYAAEKSRNSNLSKLVEFKGKALLRAFPSTANEAIEIANAIASDRVT